MAPLGPKMLNTANRALWWVPVIANIHAPTVTEVAAGKNLTCLVTAADFSLGVTGNEEIKDPAFCDKLDAGIPGRATIEAAMNFFRFKNALDDTAWTTFDGAGLSGYLVQRIGQIEDGEAQEDVPVKAADEVQVYEAITWDQQILSPASAGYEKFRQPFSVQKAEERAKVAAP